MTWQQLGLASFVLTTFMMLGALAYDLYLGLSGHMLITIYCRANPWAAWVLLSIIEFGVIGLAVHFMAIVKID